MSLVDKGRLPFLTPPAEAAIDRRIASAYRVLAKRIGEFDLEGIGREHRSIRRGLLDTFVNAPDDENAYTSSSDRDLELSAISSERREQDIGLALELALILRQKGLDANGSVTPSPEARLSNADMTLVNGILTTVAPALDKFIDSLPLSLQQNSRAFYTAKFYERCRDDYWFLLSENIIDIDDASDKHPDSKLYRTPAAYCFSLLSETRPHGIFRDTAKLILKSPTILSNMYHHVPSDPIGSPYAQHAMKSVTKKWKKSSTILRAILARRGRENKKVPTLDERIDAALSYTLFDGEPKWMGMLLHAAQTVHAYDPNNDRYSAIVEGIVDNARWRHRNPEIYERSKPRLKDLSAAFPVIDSYDLQNLKGEQQLYLSQQTKVIDEKEAEEQGVIPIGRLWKNIRENSVSYARDETQQVLAVCQMLASYARATTIMKEFDYHLTKERTPVDSGDRRTEGILRKTDGKHLQVLERAFHDKAGIIWRIVDREEERLHEVVDQYSSRILQVAGFGTGRNALIEAKQRWTYHSDGFEVRPDPFAHIVRKLAPEFATYGGKKIFQRLKDENPLYTRRDAFVQVGKSIVTGHGLKLLMDIGEKSTIPDSPRHVTVDMPESVQKAFRSLGPQYIPHHKLQVLQTYDSILQNEYVQDENNVPTLGLIGALTSRLGDSRHARKFFGMTINWAHEADKQDHPYSLEWQIYGLYGTAVMYNNDNVKRNLFLVQAAGLATLAYLQARPSITRATPLQYHCVLNPLNYDLRSSLLQNGALNEDRRNTEISQAISELTTIIQSQSTPDYNKYRIKDAQVLNYFKLHLQQYQALQQRPQATKQISSGSPEPVQQLMELFAADLRAEPITAKLSADSEPYRMTGTGIPLEKPAGYDEWRRQQAQPYEVTTDK